jgi:hypothetical protein
MLPLCRVQARDAEHENFRGRLVDLQEELERLTAAAHRLEDQVDRNVAAAISAAYAGPHGNEGHEQHSGTKDCARQSC